MILVNASAHLPKELNPTYEQLLMQISVPASKCYRSEAYKNAEDFVQRLMDRHHDAMLEFGFIQMHIICDRGVSHEIVRHRHFSFAQESTRYCNYSKEKFGSELTFVKPYWWRTRPNHQPRFKNVCTFAEDMYMAAVQNGWSPQDARGVLPHWVATGIVVGGNIREWRHFIKLRDLGVTGAPHPDMLVVAHECLLELNAAYPVFFKDLLSSKPSL